MYLLPTMLSSTSLHVRNNPSDSLGVIKVLPVEIWHRILKIAIMTTWLQDRFMPPPDNVALIKGFSEASPFCGKLAEEIYPETVRFYNKDEISAYTKSQWIKHLSIREHVDHQSLQVIAQYRQLLSLSLFDRMPLSAQFANRLVRLDYMSLNSHEDWTTANLSNLPCLEELQLGSRDVDKEMSPTMRAFPANLSFADEVAFANCILRIVTPLKNLQLLSIRVALDSTVSLAQTVFQHTSSIDHLIPSEGYERHYSECPMCTAVYDHNAVVCAENKATRILAERMPNLRRVSWANAWVREWEDESGQRGTNIVRTVGDPKPMILLVRDDGLI